MTYGSQRGRRQVVRGCERDDNRRGREPVRQLARQLDAEENSRAKTETELAASDFGEGVARGLQQAGLPSDNATVANIVRDLQSRLQNPKR